MPQLPHSQNIHGWAPRPSQRQLLCVAVVVHWSLSSLLLCGTHPPIPSWGWENPSRPPETSPPSGSLAGLTALVATSFSPVSPGFHRSHILPARCWPPRWPPPRLSSRVAGASCTHSVNACRGSGTARPGSAGPWGGSDNSALSSCPWWEIGWQGVIYNTVIGPTSPSRSLLPG